MLIGHSILMITGLLQVSVLFLALVWFPWHSKKQHTVSWSGTEAKYKNLANLRVEISWIKALLEKLQILCTRTPTIWCDNLNTVLLSTNPVQHARTKHIELDLYFLCEMISWGSIVVCHIPAQDQVVDILTKTISSTRFYELRINLKVKPLSNLSLRGMLEIVVKSLLKFVMVVMQLISIN